MSHSLFINARGMLRRKPPGYYDKIEQLYDEIVGERSNLAGPAQVGLGRSEDRPRRPLTRDLEPWWTKGPLA